MSSVLLMAPAVSGEALDDAGAAGGLAAADGEDEPSSEFFADDGAEDELSDAGFAPAAGAPAGGSTRAMSGSALPEAGRLC
jgi:hypothetical protein